MIKRGLEFGLGLAGSIISILGGLGLLLVGIIFLMMGSVNDYIGSDSFGFGGMLQFFMVFMSIVVFVMGVVYLLGGIGGLIPAIMLKSRKATNAKGLGIALIISGVFSIGGFLQITSGILAIGKSPERILEGKIKDRNLEFGLGLAGSILMVLSFFGWIISKSFNSSMMAEIGYYSSPMEGLFNLFMDGFFVIGMIILFTLGLIGTILIKKQPVEVSGKAPGVFLLVSGILGMNFLLLSAGILAFTKRVSPVKKEELESKGDINVGAL